MAMTRSHNNNQVEERPAKLFELVRVEALFQREHEKDHASCQEAESVEGVVLKKHVIKESGEHNARV